MKMTFLLISCNAHAVHFVHNGCSQRKVILKETAGQQVLSSKKAKVHGKIETYSKMKRGLWPTDNNKKCYSH